MDVLCLLSYISVFYYFLYFLIICKNCSDNLTNDVRYLLRHVSIYYLVVANVGSAQGSPALRA